MFIGGMILLIGLIVTILYFVGVFSSNIELFNINIRCKTLNDYDIIEAIPEKNHHKLKIGDNYLSCDEGVITLSTNNSIHCLFYLNKINTDELVTTDTYVITKIINDNAHPIYQLQDNTFHIDMDIIYTNGDELDDRYLFTSGECKNTDEINTDEINTDEINTDETTPDETTPDETPLDETPLDETPPDESNSDEITPDEINTDEFNTDETPPDETSPDEITPDEINTDESNTDEFTSDETTTDDMDDY